MKTKLLKFQVFLFALICSVSAYAASYSFVADKVYYNILSATDKTVEVVNGSSDYSGDVVIPATVANGDVTYSVVAIADNAFSNCTGLTSVSIPASVASIGSYAFAYCSGLTAVELPESLTSIAERTFSECSSLASVTIPAKVASIGDRSFYNCKKLDNLTIGAGVKTIGSFAFQGCKAMSSLTIGPAVETISMGAFLSCSSLEEVTIPASVKSIGERAFTTCYSLTNINVEDASANFTSVDGVLFSKDKKQLVIFPYANATTYTAPAGVETICAYAFKNCYDLTSVVLPASVKTIETSAFNGCDAMKSINLGGVETIANDAFGDCASLTSVAIPATTTSIANGTFAGCTELTEFVVDAANPSFASEDGVLFNKNKTVLLAYPNECGTSYTTPSTVLEIAKFAFAYCSSLETLKITSPVQTIGESAFISCDGMKDVTIPGTVTSIGGYAFEDCSSLRNVYISDMKAWCETDFVNYKSNPLHKAKTLYCDSKSVASLEIPEGTTKVKNFAFYGYENLEDVDIPASVTAIGESAFENCTTMTDVYIGAGVETIGESAFAYCSSITDVWNYSTTPQSIDSDVFRDVDIDYATLHVQTGYKSDYEDASVWGDFGDIKEFVPSGVEVADKAEVDVKVVGGEIIVNGGDADVFVKVYSINGAQVYAGSSKNISVASGMYVVSVAGHNYKVVVK